MEMDPVDHGMGVCVLTMRQGTNIIDQALVQGSETSCLTMTMTERTVVSASTSRSSSLGPVEFSRCLLTWHWTFGVSELDNHTHTEQRCMLTHRTRGSNSN